MKTNTTTIEVFHCPLCQTQLVEQVGNVMHPGDAKYGINLHCPAPHPQVCPAQEVFGHGDSAKAAFEVVKQKYKKS